MRSIAEVNLTREEASVVRAVLTRAAIRGRTGEVGIIHGADRFVSSQLVLKGKERDALAAAVSKRGLARLSEVK